MALLDPKTVISPAKLKDYLLVLLPKDDKSQSKTKHIPLEHCQTGGDCLPITHSTPKQITLNKSFGKDQL